MQWISPYNIYLLIFFSAGGETKESDRSKDTTLVSDKPNQGERSRRPLAFFLTNFTLCRKANTVLNKGLAATFIGCLNLSHTQLGLYRNLAQPCSREPH